MKIIDIYFEKHTNEKEKYKKMLINLKNNEFYSLSLMLFTAISIAMIVILIMRDIMFLKHNLKEIHIILMLCFLLITLILYIIYFLGCKIEKQLSEGNEQYLTFLQNVLKKHYNFDLKNKLKNTISCHENKNFEKEIYNILYTIKENFNFNKEKFQINVNGLKINSDVLWGRCQYNFDNLEHFLKNKWILIKLLSSIDLKQKEMKQDYEQDLKNKLKDFEHHEKMKEFISKL